MTGLTIIKSRWEKNVAVIKFRVDHPMESGFRYNKDKEHYFPAVDKKTKKRRQPHYITRISAKLNGKLVFNARWSGAISKTPGMSFKLKGAKKGDTVRIDWIDNTGKKGGNSHIIE